MTDVPSLRLLRALTWLRWRILWNAITRSGARDLLERLSRAAESLLPIAVVLLLVPTALSLATLGTWAGSMVAGEAEGASLPVQTVRWMLLLILVLTLMGPMLLASSGQQPSGILRLRLLPIPDHLLYVAHAAGALADPWVFLSIPLLLGVAAGLLLGGAAAAALLAAAAGLVFLAALLGLAALASALLQLLVRDRRRAEVVVLAAMLLVVAVSLLPSMLLPQADEVDQGRGHDTPMASIPRWVGAAARLVPSELYVQVLNAVPSRHSGAAVGLLVLWAVAAHGLTWPVYLRLLQTPATIGGARRVAGGRARGIPVPGVGPVVSAVALAFARLGFRTPRGRSIVLMPIVMIAVFAAVGAVRDRALPLGPVQMAGGYSLAIFGLALSQLSLAPFAFNQFAVDRAGLTLEFLAPISARQLLYGKAIGAALMAALPGVLSIVAGAATGGRSLQLWLAILLGSGATYLCFAPVAAVLAMLFPRAVDLSSIGQASNAHQAAGLLGVLAFALTSAPAGVLGAVGLAVMDSPTAAVALLAAWLAVSILLSRAGFRVAERLLEARRENLALVAQGR